MRKILAKSVLVLALIFSQNAFGQNKLTDLNTRREADGAFIQGDFVSALKLYKVLVNNGSATSFLNYRIGFCYLEMGDVDDAISYFEEVKGNSLKPKYADFFFAYGKAFHKKGKYQDALEKYEAFKKKGKKKDIKYYEVDRFIKQCNFALQAIEKPVAVDFSNMGDSINSDYDDYHPSISADGKTLIFTSRRSGSKGGELLEDGQYYEDIYQSTYDTVNKTWRDAVPVPGALNSDEWDANTSITPDGKNILIYRNSEAENSKLISPTGGGDLYISKLGNSGKWSGPKMLEGLNSTYYDGNGVMTPDGKKIFFISDRSSAFNKGQGGRDIWVSEKGPEGTWMKPKNLGAVINTPYDERSVFIHPDGKTLFFTSEGHDDKNLGGFDVFRTTFENGKWSVPENLGYPINTHRDEKEFVLSTDGKVAWMSTKRDSGATNVDIYEVDLTHYNVLTGESDPISILKGSVTDASTGLPLKTEIVIKNNATGEEFKVQSTEEGNYFNTLVSNQSYTVSINIDGYKPFSETFEIKAPPKPKKPKRKRRPRRRRRGKKKKKTTGTHTVVRHFKVERVNPISVVSKELFKTQIISFVKSENGYTINEFSKGVLDLFAKQIIQSPDLLIEVEGHFDNNGGNGEAAYDNSQKLANLVIEYLKSQGAKTSKVKVVAKGSSEPTADNDTEQGRAANRRVEIRIVL